ncbi:glycoside hydrolase family 31 protein [Dysgonomonas macrotermitis]|uniref:Alpha-glucosidase n=1 Tax=Dysgonomonas macrotermitis TaxID=1346286 RepID=A0A1M4X758_9BACT|nr:glycoside hydrolase family 31 protein [Dysgonomonas macrotermitis]SHE89316.1 alpha-glucosidase [Dysgonomonas macrotermitis]
MKKALFLPLILICNIIAAQHITTISFPSDEYWWGGVVAYGERMPYIQPLNEYNLETQNNNNQVVPLLLSNKGRYVWSDKPFRFSVSAGKITIKSDFENISVLKAGATLRDAYLAACQKHFNPGGQLPEELFFTMPQYNTWIELMYNQNQEDILKYAHGIIENGLPPGVLMIDDNWQRYYGNFDFRGEKFPDPKGMIKQLHDMGFKVMLWICPFVSADSQEYRELNTKGYLLKNKNGKPAIINWWNGQSACYDFTNPEAKKHFISVLKNMQEEYGIDGFKFDAGDNNFYTNKDLVSYRKDAVSVDHTEEWLKIGLEFPVNEYRAGWKMGGQPLVQRLGDKSYSWNAVQSLIPQMIAAGLMGYAYTCPDMIGGGQIKNFINLKADKFDQTLIVRSAQVHAMMPMMQFSVAPWRVLNAENLATVRNMAHLHEQMGAYILQCAQESAQTGEPIVRHMEYSYPDEGFAECKDQFMLGDKYMVAPVVTKENKRSVKLPKGQWKDDLGKIHKGEQIITIDVPLSRLPYFEKINN